MCYDRVKNKKGMVVLDYIINALAKADWTVLLVIIIAILVSIWQTSRSNKELREDLKDVRGDLNNVREELRTVHFLRDDIKHSQEKNDVAKVSIKGDTKPTYLMLLEEKSNREKLYDNTSRAKEILDTMDLMREVVNQNAKLNQEVAKLEVKNEKLSHKQKNESNQRSKELLGALRRFEIQLSEFENYKEASRITDSLRVIERQVSSFEDEKD